MVSVAALMAASMGAAELPRKSPALSIGLSDGKQLSINSYKGKVVVLAFILTTCPHCQHTTGLLKDLQAALSGRGVQFVEAAIDRNAAPLVPGFIKSYQPNFPVGASSYDTAVAYLQHPATAIMHVPSLVFIDRQGMIRAQYDGADAFFSGDQEKNIRDQINSLLTAPKPATKTAARTASK